LYEVEWYLNGSI